MLKIRTLQKFLFNDSLYKLYRIFYQN